jgi:predicted transcriptional regulator
MFFRDYNLLVGRTIPSELARRAGSRQAYIARIEDGLAKPRLDLLMRLAGVLDLGFDLTHAVMQAVNE